MHRIHAELESEVLVLSAAGELDAYVAEPLAETMRDARIVALGRFVADLSNVSFMDSTALGIVVRGVKDVIERGGQARVVLPNGTARRIFEITTLDRVLPIAPSRAHAVRDLSSAGGASVADEPEP